jgi:hypothetical protein
VSYYNTGTAENCTFHAIALRKKSAAAFLTVPAEIKSDGYLTNCVLSDRSGFGDHKPGLVSPGFRGKAMVKKKEKCYPISNMVRRIVTMKPFQAVLACLFLFPGLLFSQEAGSDAVFAPFVSQISAEVKNDLVRISWTDSRDVRGPVYLYRSAGPFNGMLPSSRPVEVPYGTETYIDEVDPGTWYYLAVASDETGRRYTLFIPMNNTISVNVNGGEETVWGAEREEPRGNPPARVSVPAETPLGNLESAARGEGVLISFRTTERTRRAVLYRRTKPIRQIEDLVDAVLVQSGISSPFTDYPVPGIPCYYAVIFEDDLISGRAAIFPGQNATVTAVSAAGRNPAEPAAKPRAIPLPLFSVTTAAPESAGALGGERAEIPKPQALNPETARALADLRRPERRPAQEKQPRVFEQDLQEPGGGEEYALRSIVQGPFARQEWEDAREELIRYLALPRNAASESRARYYLGQACYFSGKIREALFEFLTIQSDYPGEVSEWIQAALTKLAD